jgi:hypothetical protein
MVQDQDRRGLAANGERLDTQRDDQGKERQNGARATGPECVSHLS